MVLERLLGKGGRHSDKNGGRSVDELLSTSSDGNKAKGPFDEVAPDDDIERVDLGSLLVPKLPGTEIRLEGTAQAGPVGVLVVDGRSGVHLVACSAPRTEGLWDEIREALQAGLPENATNVREAPGELGTELRAEVHTPQGIQYVRFIGIDGPRWMLRAVISGAAGDDPSLDALLVRVIRATVVVRGEEPLPIRQPLELRIPGDTDIEMEEPNPHRSKYAVTVQGIPQLEEPEEEAS